jgi:hypothetical protein
MAQTRSAPPLSCRQSGSADQLDRFRPEPQKFLAECTLHNVHILAAGLDPTEMIVLRKSVLEFLNNLWGAREPSRNRVLVPARQAI